MLGELYRASGRFLDGLDAFQRAIEAEATSKLLYLRYVDLIFIITLNGLTFDEFVLIEPDDYAGEPDGTLMAYEVVQALEAAFQLDPTDTELLRRQLRQYIALQDTDAVWRGFERFLKLEPEWSQLRSVIDDMELLEDLEPSVVMLDRAIRAQPQRANLMIALAIVYLYEGEEALATETLERAEKLTDDEDLLAEIDRIFLRAQDPEFETRLGDIQALVSAGSKLSHRDLEFLEDAIEQAPEIGEFYLVLGKAYRDLDDPDAALETLLDGHEQVPDDPDILAALGEVLWESDQKSLAFDYLNQGISKHPNHIALLARTGQYLFESGQDEEARLFLARAEAINPRDPFLQEVRRVIARHMAERGK
jgi:tetratricopeptide (TPR) repeat protein